MDVSYGHGSGKSYLAKMLRDLEVYHGGDAPRIHSMDDYFMTEVEKDAETSFKIIMYRSKYTLNSFTPLCKYILRKYFKDSSKDEKRWDAEEDHPAEVKELNRSKWSSNLGEDETEGSKAVKRNLNALSGLIQAYGNKGKSVHWSDKKSNPLPRAESHTSNSIGNSKKQSSFQERLCAGRNPLKLFLTGRRDWRA
ncbi:hypothetical protein F3Y22_tig00110384pilonHSYRG00756 [Hibiscus syriacus]|uniref:Uncharacterized protein n=1 Tax=Hibiscus syriacus TaxID=106335 RepID=A0A6A3ARR4_HIBSY|nr:hypothetical protein F3Y22_tig00110384pilonHSYRG00756 [Hibiscus syriacus]